MGTNHAYLAGILDGEGSIVLHRDYRNSRIWGEMIIYNTSVELMDWIESNYGGNIYMTRPQATDRQQGYTIKWGVREGSAILRDIKSYLIIKRDKAEMFCELADYCKFGIFGHDREKQQMIYDEFYKEGKGYSMAKEKTGGGNA